MDTDNKSSFRFFRHKAHRLSGWQAILLGYIMLIIMGSFMLWLPFANKSGSISYINALFTSASATCVTGLSVFDTFSHWTLFGQIVILFLIQTGGIGIMTIVSLFTMAIKGKIGLYDNLVIMHSAGNSRLSDSRRLVKRIIVGTLIFEGAGTVMLSLRFCFELGFWRGLWFAVFHSVSAFCNAGFDLMGINKEFSSLATYANDPVVLLTISLLILAGGLGFIVWSDIISNGIRFKRYQTHTKVVLWATAAFIIIPTILFLIFEKNNLFKGMGFGQALLSSIFNTITPRTAGFTSVNLANMTDSSIALSMMLMFVGGNTGSTAGGIKLTTLMVIVFGVIAAYRNRTDIQIGKKRMPFVLLLQSLCIAATYLFMVSATSLLLLAVEPFSFVEVVFETVSAISTTGLSLGITPNLTAFSKLTLSVLMFLGKVGVITLLYAMASNKKKPNIKRPMDAIGIG